MKTLAVLKHLQFGDNINDKMKLGESKRQHLDEQNNKERNSLDKDESEIKDVRYILSPFISLFPLFQKESNRLSNLGKETRSLNHLI